ncbi:MAG: anti-sigma factor [Gilvibacter sp.]
MNQIEKYIASGILELYVAGALSEQENREVAAMSDKHPQIALEIQHIEQAVRVLTASLSPGVSKDAVVIIPATSKVRSLWPMYAGWAAAVLAVVGLFYMFNQNSQLESDLTDAQEVQQTLESELTDLVEAYDVSNSILEELRDKDVQKIALPGQGNFSEAFAAVYWNQTTETLYVDTNGLPTPPEGKQYQLWSLTLSPLTPTSLGVLDAATADLNLFKVDNPNASQAFGITLEPTGGSESPNLEQLYVLGTVAP